MLRREIYPYIHVISTCLRFSLIVHVTYMHQSLSILCLEVCQRSDLCSFLCFDVCQRSDLCCFLSNPLHARYELLQVVSTGNERGILNTRGAHLRPVLRTSCVFESSRTTNGHPLGRVVPRAERLSPIGITVVSRGIYLFCCCRI